MVGAGIAGLTLARLLCRQGPAAGDHRAVRGGRGRVRGRPVPAGQLCPARARQLQRAHGAVAGCRAVRARPGSGRVLQSLDTSVLAGAGGPLLMVSRGDLASVLEASCASADLRRGLTVDSLVQHPDGGADVFADGRPLRRRDRLRRHVRPDPRARLRPGGGLRLRLGAVDLAGRQHPVRPGRRANGWARPGSSGCTRCQAG